MHTFKSTLASFTERTASFQHGSFPEKVRYPMHCCRGLCKMTTPMITLEMHSRLMAAFNQLVKTFKRPIDAHLVLACEVKGPGISGVKTIFAEMVVALGRTAAQDAQQVFLTYDVIDGEICPPFTGIHLVAQRWDFVQQTVSVLKPCVDPCQGSLKHYTNAEFCAHLLRMPLPTGYAIEVIIRPLNCRMEFSRTNGFDDLYVTGIIDDPELQNVKVNQQGEKRKQDQVKEDQGAPDFLQGLADRSKSRSRCMPTCSRPAPPPADGFDFLRELEALLELPGEKGDDDHDDEDLNRELSELLAAEREHESEAAEIAQHDSDHEEQADDCSNTGEAEQAEPPDEVAEICDTTELLDSFGLQEMLGWRVCEKNSGKVVGQLKWMLATDTLDVVCRCHGDPIHKMMLRVPMRLRGSAGHRKGDLIRAAYCWLNEGRRLARPQHEEASGRVKRMFGMKPRG